MDLQQQGRIIGIRRQNVVVIRRNGGLSDIETQIEGAAYGCRTGDSDQRPQPMCAIYHETEYRQRDGPRLLRRLSAANTGNAQEREDQINSDYRLEHRCASAKFQ